MLILFSVAYHLLVPEELGFFKRIFFSGTLHTLTMFF